MKTIIHVNQHKIASNRKNGTNLPPLIARTYKGSKPANEIMIHDANGDVVARIVHRPHDPLPCGARVWIETENEVTLT